MNDVYGADLFDKRIKLSQFAFFEPKPELMLDSADADDTSLEDLLRRLS